jgi:hypothetical protein
MAQHPTRIDLPAKTRGRVCDHLAALPDLFTGMAGDIDKQLWLVEAHLQADG